jgi:acetate kinase
MSVLVVNCGSSSIKYRLYAVDNGVIGENLAEGLVERIGTPDSKSKYKAFKRMPSAGTPFKEPREHVVTDAIPDHEAAMRLVLKMILDKDIGVVGDVSDVKIVGHRLVHGSDKFSKPTIITREVKAMIEECCKFAPLHNPVNLLGVEACEKLFPAATQAGVFDTAFHSTMPKHAYLYAIPYSLYEKHAIRRYGFHGTSHKYVSRRCADICAKHGKKAEKIIVCHLGNGASITAIKDGKSVDTTMGFTPLEGLIMGTRSGDVDPGVLTSLGRLEGMSVDAIDTMLNKNSGFKGITEETSDSLVVEIKALEGHERYRLAMTMHNYRVQKYIGSYAAAMGGVDAIVFTGGVGENSAIIREEISVNLGFLGVEFDVEKNKVRSRDERFVTFPHSRTAVLVIPTNEEWQIASESLEIVKSARS